MPRRLDRELRPVASTTDAISVHREPYCVIFPYVAFSTFLLIIVAEVLAAADRKAGLGWAEVDMGSVFSPGLGNFSRSSSRKFSRKFSGRFSKDLAIDLGTANTLVYRRGEGLVCNEPSVVAIRQSNDGERRILAIGAEAKKMLGRVPSAISVIRPIRDGVISDFEGTRMMLRHFIRKACGARNLTRPRITVR